MNRRWLALFAISWGSFLLAPLPASAGGHGGGGGSHGGGHFGGGGGHGGGIGHSEFHDSFHGDGGFERFGRRGHPGFYGYGAGCVLGGGYLGYDDGYGDFGPPIYGSSEDFPCPLSGAPDPNAPQPPDQNKPETPPPLKLTDADVLLSVRVDADATVWINDTLTTETGPRRDFISSGLTSGHTYCYNVSARWIGPDGTVIFRKKQVHVKGGERRMIEFTPPQD